MSPATPIQQTDASLPPTILGNGAFTPILWLALAYISVFGYLAFLQPLMQRVINRRSAERIETLRSVGGYFVVKGQMDVGTVVAFVSGLAKVNDPWGDLVDWFREMTLARTRYHLLRDAMEMLRQPGD